MANDRQRRVGNDRDSGITLIELLLSVVMIGVISTTLAGVIVVALRTTPPTEARVDDARGLQGLVTWLPQDVDAAPPDGFDRDPSSWPCAGPAPAESYNVLSIGWTEVAAATTDYDASYRYENTSGGWTMARYFCVNSGTADRINLTSTLPPWNSTNPPAYTVMCAVVIDASAVFDGTCPAADTYPATDMAPAPVRSLKFKVDIDGALGITIDAAPKNPDEDLSDDPNATANQPPNVQNQAISLSLVKNETAVYDLAGYLGTVDDPDGDNSALTVSIDPTEPMPSNLVSATTAYNGAVQFELTLTAGSTTGTASQPLMLIVSDERGGWKVVEATITVTNPPPVPPWLDATDPDTRSIGIAADDQTLLIDIPSLFNVQDDQPVDDLVLSLTSVTHSTVPVAVDGSKYAIGTVGEDLQVEFDSGFNSSAGGQIYVDMVLTDTEGGSLVLHLIIDILPYSTVNTPPQVLATDVPVSIEAGQSLTLDVTSASAHGASDPDPGDALFTSVQSTPASIATTTGDTNVTMAVGAGAPTGVAAPIVIRISDVAGDFVDVTITVTVTAPPPPPSDCVLGTLSVEGVDSGSSTVARQGSGGGTARKLVEDVIVTLTYSGSCDGLRLNYDSGDAATNLGSGVGRVFPPGSPSSIVIVGHFSGGTEKFTPGSHTLTASTSSDVSPSSITATLTVT